MLDQEEILDFYGAMIQELEFEEYFIFELYELHDYHLQYVLYSYLNSNKPRAQKIYQKWQNEFKNLEDLEEKFQKEKEDYFKFSPTGATSYYFTFDPTASSETVLKAPKCWDYFIVNTQSEIKMVMKQITKRRTDGQFNPISVEIKTTVNLDYKPFFEGARNNENTSVILELATSSYIQKLYDAKAYFTTLYSRKVQLEKSIQLFEKLFNLKANIT